MYDQLTLLQKINCERLAHVVLCHFSGVRLDRLIAAFWKWLNEHSDYVRKDELQYVIDILLDFPKKEG